MSASTVTPDYNAMSDEAFRRDVRTFIEREYPVPLRFILHRAHWHEMRGWWGKLHAMGWIAPNWPREHGGMGLDAGKMLIYLEELERYGCARPPDQGITQVGPLIMRFGTEAQKTQYLPRTLSGEYIWCQGYSEPNAGSDLASLQTAAVIDGSDFVINGQKIWTTPPTSTCWCVPTRQRRNSWASVSCWWISRRRASRCARFATSPGTGSSARCSSTTSAYRATRWSGR